jgi:hypothetical protein
MKEHIEFLKNEYSTHVHSLIAINILELLDYVENNLDEVLKQHGTTKGLFRHPSNHMALHIHQSATVELLENYLTTLIAEVKGCFSDMRNLQRDYPDSNIFHYFLLNISDSAVGCMEARIRNALNFAGLVLSTKATLPFNELMSTFTHEATIKNLLLHFGPYIEHHFPVLLLKEGTVPLTWDLVKSFFSETMLWDNLEENWHDYARQSVNNYTIEQWQEYVFKDQSDATARLSHIKASLPQYQKELDRITLKCTDNYFHFKLTPAQFNDYVTGSAIDRPTDKAVLIPIPNWTFYCFKTRDAAIAKLTKIKKNIGVFYPDLLKYGQVIHTPQHQDTPYRFRLTTEQHRYYLKPKKIVNPPVLYNKTLLLLIEEADISQRNQSYLLRFKSFADAKSCRDAFFQITPLIKIQLVNDYFSISSADFNKFRSALRKQQRVQLPEASRIFSKCLRSDEMNYFHPLMEELIQGIKFPKRIGPKREYTVTGI